MRASIYVEPVEERLVQMAGEVVIHAEAILGPRPAVHNVSMPAGEPFDQAAGLLRERMFVAIACAVQPPHFARRRRGGKGVQHRKDGSRTDSRAQQDDGAVARLQREYTSRRAHIQYVAGADVVVQE